MFSQRLYMLLANSGHSIHQPNSQKPGKTEVWEAQTIDSSTFRMDDGHG